MKYMIRTLAAVILVCLVSAVPQSVVTCPQADIDDPKQVTFGRRFKVTRSVANSVCVLVHLAPKQAADFREAALNVTTFSKTSDFSLTPVARSYNSRDWETVAGPYDSRSKIKVNCNTGRCLLRIRRIEPYNITGGFYLMAFTNDKTFNEDLSRFFSQSTFGGTSEMIDNWSYSQDVTGMAQFLKDQIQLPLTSLRAEYRKGADFSMKYNSITSAGVIPQHPCQQYSRWRKYAFTSAGDFGKPIEVINFSGKLLVSVDGMPRTIVQNFRSTDSSLNGKGDYDMGFRVAEDVGAQVLYKAKSNTNSNYKTLQGGNPAVVMNNNAINRDSDIVVINLPDRATNFEEIDPVESPNIMNTPASGTLRLKVDISNNANSGCDAIPHNGNYEKVLGKFPDNTYVWYDGFAELAENTPDSPIADGGVAKRQVGLLYCTNVAKNFHNIESCVLSEEVACDGSPHYNWEPQPFKANTIVCGSPNEVASIPNAPQTETSMYQFNGVGPDQFYYGLSAQKGAVWNKIKLKAMDQFRQRASWALSQLFIVTKNQIDNGDIWTEMFLAYEDIFVTNAFTNFKDLLRDVSYSPMMAEMLSYLGSASALYALRREGRVSRPDENFAREIMQLFTIGLYKLNMDGTYRRKNGELIQTYDNFDIQTFARAWTGFRSQGRRSNYEGYAWNQNKIDPMYLDGEKRDPFPKMDLDNGYIGDGHILCRDIPSRQFLRKGATYRLVGNFNKPELTPETPWWNGHVAITRTVLDPSSNLYDVLCNANGGAKCNFSTLVRLSDDIDCTGVECEVDTLSLIKIQESPPLYYEYMPFPCTELAFSNKFRKVTNRHSKAMCAEPGLQDLIFDACCPAVPPATQYWIGKAWSNCKYTGEKISYRSNEERCTSQSGTVCDFEVYNNPGTNTKCGLAVPNWLNSWHWTNQTCTTKVKVDIDGLVSIVHNPNLDINSILASKDLPEQSIYQPVSPENKNFFRVRWVNGTFPVFGQCGQCVQLVDGCLCDVEVKERTAFRTAPRTARSVINFAKLGSPYPRSDYELVSNNTVSNITGVEVYVLSADKSKLPKLTKRAIFGVIYRGEKKYLRNLKSYVAISDGSASYSFRNPPSMMSIIEQRNHDAYYETEEVLDHYVYHSNTAPFISKLMIKRLVTSNPSPNYIYRVASAFRDGIFKINNIEFGDGKYGSLEAMFAAILLDEESRNSILDSDPSFGSLKEPIVNLFAFMRAMEYKMNDKAPTLRMSFNLINKIGQEPFKSPNVFSFFLPDYSEPGDVKEASLSSPEAQIITAPTIVGGLNGYLSLIDLGLTRCYGGFGLKTVHNCLGYRNNYDPEVYSRGTLTFTPKASTASAVVDELSMLLTAGRLTASSRTVLEATYDEVLQSGGEEKALKTIQKLIVTTPEFHSTGVFKSINEARPEPPQPDPPSNPYKAIVYINLNGGLDSFNTLIPHSNCVGGKDMFKEYREVRKDVALTKGSLKTISASGQICNTFGIHGKLPFVQQLYNQEQLSFYANVGVLQQPVENKVTYRELNKKTALFAHNVQQNEITAVDINDDTAGLGVCGRMADILSLNGYSTGTVSVAGGAPAIVSKNSPLLVVNPYGYEEFNPISWKRLDKTKIKELNKASSVGSNMLSEIWSEKLFQSMSENEVLFRELLYTSLDYTFQDNDLGRQMKSIAKLIKSKDARKTDRDVFYAEVAGYDTHIVQELDLEFRLEELNAALSSFVQEMKAQGQWNNVAVVVVSEFGRTLVSNTGNGTDHAWGGNYFAASGSLKGGKILGEYPDDLTSSGSRIVSDVGIVVPTTPWEALWNGIAEWFGVTSTNDLRSILPNRQIFENNLWSASDLFK